MPSWDEMLELAQHLQADAAYDGPSTWGVQARPGDTLPAFTARPAASGSAINEAGLAMQLQPFTWGYTLPNENKLVYNARIENASGPLWADSFATRRAIVAVASFFEPHRSETERNPNTGRMGKRSYEFHLPNGKALLLGAIYRDDRISVVTTEPNQAIAPVHHRMPLALRFEEIPLWLGPNWSALADRSSIDLTHTPEHPAPPQPEQPSLF